MDMFVWSLQGLFALIAISLPYVALCAWFSAANDSPMVSLVICNLVIGGVGGLDVAPGDEPQAERVDDAVARHLPVGLERNNFV